MIDLTGIASAVIAGVFTIAAVVIPMIIQSHMKDQHAAEVLSNAIVNSLGAIKQAVIDGRTPPAIPGVPPRLAVGVEYIQNHAGPEADRSNQTPELLADKILAKQGLQALAVDVAAAAPAPVVNVAPSATPATTLGIGNMPRPLFPTSA